MRFGGVHSAGPIAAVIDAHELRLLQLEPRADVMRVVAAARHPLPADLPRRGPEAHEAIAHAIREATSKGGFVGRRLITSLPPSVVHVKNLRLPLMPADELPQAIEWEAKERVQLEPEPHLLRFFDAGEVRQGEESRREIILLAVAEAYAEGHAAALLEQGFHLEAIEAAPAGLARFVRRSAPSDQAMMILDVGNTTSTAMILNHGRVLFCKSVPIGGRQLDQAVATYLDLPTEEARRHRLRFDRQEEPHPTATLSDEREDESHDAVGEEARRAVFEAVRPCLSDLAREVGLCLRYFGVTFRGDRPTAVSVSGEESESRWLAELLAEAATVSVGRADPLLKCERADVALREDPIRSAWTVPFGIAVGRQHERAARKGAA